MTTPPPNDPSEGKRKPYEKPTLSEVALRPDEAVLGNCKTVSVSGPANMSDCTYAGGCSTAGS